MSSTELTLKFGEEHKINATSTSPIIYQSSDEYHATVSNSGLIDARFVGDANISLSNADDSKSIKVTIEPQYNLYKTPSLNWGTLRSEIITQYGVPESSTADVILYDDYSNSAPILMFLFDDQDRLISSSVMVKSRYSSDLGSFLAERYPLISSDDAILLMDALEFDDATTIISADLYNLSYWMVMYFAPAVGRSSEADIKNQFNELFNQMK